MKEKIKSICLSKSNFIALSLSLFAFLKDFQELITSFASHLLLVGISIIFFVVLLVINLFLSKNKSSGTKDEERKNSVKTHQYRDSKNAFNLSNKRISIFPKIIFSCILFFTLMTLGSLYYVKNLGVYYVVLKNDITLNEAIQLMDETNNSSGFSQLGLSSRILELGDNNYELILFNGYINENKADIDLEKIKSIKTDFKPYKVGPQNVANYFKKIKYLQNDIFN